MAMPSLPQDLHGLPIVCLPAQGVYLAADDGAGCWVREQHGNQLTVRYIEAEGIYRIVTGERRHRATCEAGLTELPCWVQSLKENQVLSHQIVENWQRLDMDPYDLALALARLRDTNRLSQRDLARETGKSEGEISKVLAILDLAPEVQRMAREDAERRITHRHLYAVHALPADQQVALITKARDEAINAEEMEHLVKQRVEAAKGPRRRGAPVVAGGSRRPRRR